jgi:pyridoxamine 5'-phosphate oxidase
LEEALEELKKEVSNREIKRPENWGGYVVKPFSLEFWQGRPNRLHDRIRYTLREDSHWKIERLAP